MNNFFKDTKTGDVYSYDDDQVAAGYVKDGLIKMTREEISAHTKPQPTKDQLIEQAEARKQYLIAEVHTETEMLRTKLALGRIKEDERALLNAWLDYLDLLEAVDVSAAPDIDWPAKP